MRRKKKSILSFAVLLSFIIILPSFSYGDVLSDANERKEILEQELALSQARSDELLLDAGNLESIITEIDSQIYDIEVLISGYEYECSVIQSDADSIQLGIDEKQALIDEKQADIDIKTSGIETMETDISDKEKEVAEKQMEMDEYYSRMGMRIQYIYENMDNKLVEAVFSSESFGEALVSIQYLNDLNAYDKTQLDEISILKDELETALSELETDTENLETDKNALESEVKELQEEIEALKADRELAAEKLEQVESIKSAAAAQGEIKEDIKSIKMDLLGFTYSELTENEATEADIWAELSSEISIIEELTSVYDESFSENSESMILSWPLPAEFGVDHISSVYGFRTHPVTGEAESFHSGLDIWCPQGTPIFACGAGIVVANEYDSSAGNWTVIYHGNGMYTEYMHQDYLGAVYVGQEVEAGQWIGAVGTTGSSTGYHLHLGLAFCNNGYFEGAGRVDPAPYLGIIY